MTWRQFTSRWRFGSSMRICRACPMWTSANVCLALHSPMVALALERVPHGHRLPRRGAPHRDGHNGVRLIRAERHGRYVDVHGGDVQVRAFGKIIDDCLPDGFLIVDAALARSARAHDEDG